MKVVLVFSIFLIRVFLLSKVPREENWVWFSGSNSALEADRNIAFKGNKIRLVFALFVYAILHVKDVDIFETQNVDGHSK